MPTYPQLGLTANLAVLPEFDADLSCRHLLTHPPTANHFVLTVLVTWASSLLTTHARLRPKTIANSFRSRAGKAAMPEQLANMSKPAFWLSSSAAVALEWASLLPFVLGLIKAVNYSQT